MGVGKGTGRGGYRANSGRKSPDGLSVFASFTIVVDKASHDLIREYGGENGSHGVRAICHALLALQGTPAKTVAKSPAKKLVKPVWVEPSFEMPGGGMYGITKRVQIRAEAERKFKEDTAEYERLKSIS